MSDTTETRRSRVILLVVAVFALVAGLTIGWALVDSSDDRSGGPSTATVATVDEWMAAVQAKDTGRIVALYSDDATWRDEADLDGNGNATEFIGKTGVASGWSIWGLIDEVLDVEAVAVTDDAAVVRWTFDGYTDWKLTGLSVLEFDDGVITAETVYYDSRQGP